ncbi:hypothetical protein LEMLEM_LOCUS7761 [Lemmus lemmus]
MPCAVRSNLGGPSEPVRTVARQPHATEVEASLAPEWEEAQCLQGIGGSGQSETGRAPGAGGGGGGVGRAYRPAGVGAPTQQNMVFLGRGGECCRKERACREGNEQVCRKTGGLKLKPKESVLGSHVPCLSLYFLIHYRVYWHLPCGERRLHQTKQFSDPQQRRRPVSARMEDGVS